MKEAYESWNPKAETLERVEQCEEIIDEYQAQGLVLTLRQLYYQFVSRGLIDNSDKSYKNLGNIVAKARMAGMLDWDAIEDRGRKPDIPNEFSGLKELVDVALRSYKLDRWKGQEQYIELWVEKAALAGVLEPLAREFHVTLMVNKGYSSLSAMKESADRMMEKHEERSLVGPCLVFYLGDHDPSGQDMVRDIEERLNKFTEYQPEVQVETIALTTAQVNQYNPPPNPTKLTDSRATGYVDRHGYESWEVDALPPNVLQRLIRDSFEKRIDMVLMEEIKERERRDKAQLRMAVEKLLK